MAPIYYLFLSTGNGNFAWPWLIAILFIVGWLIYKHKKNIHNLLHGKESKIGSGKKAQNKFTASNSINRKAKKR
jgi:glycerol-3-phosphate acyltransferase PlsY